jgi:hypothetical protein
MVEMAEIAIFTVGTPALWEEAAPTALPCIVAHRADRGELSKWSRSDLRQTIFII